jgi:hypothetical protein
MDPTSSTSKSSSAAVIGIVALVIGLAIGFGVTKATDKSDTSSTSSTDSMHMTTAMSAKAAGLHTTLVTLGVQHMRLTDQAVDAALNGSPDAAALGTALNTNGTTLGAAVGSVYGKDAETTFNTVWQLHLNDFVKYAVAGSKGDEAGKTAALADIDANYTKPLAQYLAKANPNLPEATVETALRDHVDMTAKVIDMHNAKDYAGEANEMTMADTHIGSLFDTLAGAIVKQYPAKFN